MDPDRPRVYKRYLEPGSHEPIPSSSWYRYRRQRLQEVPDPQTADVAVQVNTMRRGANAENEITFHRPCIPEEHNTIEESEIVADQTTVEENRVIAETIQVLTEDLDHIENEVHHLAEEENREDPDYFIDDMNDADCFIDAIDNDDAVDAENTEQESAKHFTSLEDAIHNKTFMTPIDTPVNITVGEIALMILKFAIIHALSLTAIADLFALINCIFGKALLPNTKYFIEKLFNPKNCMKLYATCFQCGAGLGRFDRKDSFLNCKTCDANVNVRDNSYKDFFVMMDVASPISKLIEANSEYYNFIVNERVHEEGYIRDIYDGHRYREFVTSLHKDDRHRYATVNFNTDGAPLFESSTYSIWPIFLMLNEVPFHVRNKELILVGLWFGKDKPNMSVFLDPFVDCMNDLSKKGVDCVMNGIQISIKIFTLICCVDSVARAPVQGFTQFNGRYGCGQCLHPGEYVRSNPDNPRSGNIKYPLINFVPEKRNMKDTVKHMREAVGCKRPVFGVKCPSPLINLLHYDFINGCVVDSMHCCSGIAKQFATMWFGSKKKSGLLPRSTILKIDALMINIKSPHQVGRLTRSLSEKEFWKSREWENWTLFYSMIVLKDILPDRLLMHWALFVEAFHILSRGEIQVHEVDRANQLFYEFVGQSEMLYSKVSMTFNMHSLVHLARSVHDWGPLWCHNAYGFESGNGYLLKVIHAAKGVHQQICRRISLKYSLLNLEDHVSQFFSFAVKHYCNTIGTTIGKQALKINHITYFGSASAVDALWSQKFNLGELAVSYKKVVKNGCLYVSSVKSNKRSNNSFAQLKDGSYVNMDNFIVDPGTGQEYTIVRRVHTINAYNHTCDMLRKIVRIIDEQTAISSNDIAVVCVHMATKANEYLCAVPNLHYY